MSPPDCRLARGPGVSMTTYMEWKKEKEAAGELKALADRLCRDIAIGRVKDLPELEERIEQVRARCLNLFP